MWSMIAVQSYKNVLVGIDFSHACEATLERAQAIAAQGPGQLVLLHVVEHFPEEIAPSQIAPEDIDPKQFIVDQATKKLAALAQAKGCAQAGQLVRLTPRSAVRELVDVALAEGSDLIVVGAHTKRPVMGRMGSTAMGVINSAPCDVLLVNPPE